MIAKLKAFGAFWYDFVVGDDWRVALGVVAALAITDGASRVTTAVWWILPLAVATIVPLSLWHATHRRVRATKRVRADPAGPPNARDRHS